MTDTKEPVERRKHERLQVKDGAYVMLKPFGSKVGELIDINMDGLTFNYIGGEDLPTTQYDTQYELDLVTTNRVFSLRDIPCKIISDFVTTNFPHSLLRIRRCGVQFRKLNGYQISQLKNFIQNHTVG